MSHVLVLVLLFVVSTDSKPTVALLSRVERDTSDGSNNWLINSNKMALGYDPVRGDPVCFTGDCRMNGFTREIFKLNYVNTPEGSCITAMIPEHVEVSCMPSTELRAQTEIISTYNELKESISKGSESGFGLSLGSFSFSYGDSDQTTKMINDIYIWNYTLYYTYVRQSYVRLMSYSPLMELSDGFRSVIEQMPCCSDANATESYIRKWLFEDFGFTYMSEIHLGGVAQQLITIEQEMQEKIRKEGYETSEEVGFSFIISFGESETEKYDKETHTKFMHYVKNVQVSTMGGQPYDMLTSNSSESSSALNEWLKTISTNPTIIKFKLESILDLITGNHFPNDPRINEKAQAIEKALNNYANGTSMKCYESCTSPTNGVCQAPVSSNPFMFGTCKCNPGFDGPDCSKPVAPTVPTPPTTPTNTPLSA